MCKYCRFCAKTWVKKYLSPGIKIVPVKAAAALPDHTWQYQTVQDIKNIVWKDVFIGYGVVSAFATITRNPEPDFSLAPVKKHFDFALNHAVALTEKFYALADEESPDVISIFNGRFIENRPLYDIARKRNIPVRINESIGGLRDQTEVMRIVYENNLPFSIPYVTELIHKVWEISEKNTEEKIREGKDFFERRRCGVPAGDRVYTANQKKGLLPENWDAGKRNIVIFNSSEDEFVSVGKDFDDYAIFKSQFDGINAILSHFTSSEYHFYLRVHPNLAKVNFAYHTDLYDLPNKYKNLTVIPATAPCSTYDLMDAAEKVIVFGSTMGVESAFWGKPTILLAGAFYHQLNICHTPKSVDEAYELIAQTDLPASASTDGAIKYGYFILNQTLLTVPRKYIDYSLYKTGKKSYSCGYTKLFGSKLLAKYLKKFFRQRAKKNSALLPDKTA